MENQSSAKFSSSLKFVNSVFKYGLPVDENTSNERQQVRGYNYSKNKPTSLKNVRIGALSKPCMKYIGLQIPNGNEQEKELAELLSGNQKFDESISFSHCYCGH